jgi:hypothetical protein
VNQQRCGDGRAATFQRRILELAASLSDDFDRLERP